MKSFGEIRQDVDERIARLEIPFNRLGFDPYGLSTEHLRWFLSVLGLLEQNYFRLDVTGLENVPARGRVMLVSNHSGGIPLDGAMIIASLFFQKEPPRLVQGMAEKFLARLPLTSVLSNRFGHLAGLPEHATRLLEDERALLVFPEGVRGTAKLYRDRYSLVPFGTGFVRLAIKTKTPIVPVAFLGGGEAVPTIYNAAWLGRLLGVPYVPVTPYLLPLPRPTRLSILFGEPMVFSGHGNEEDVRVEEQVAGVKERIAGLLARGRIRYERTSLLRSDR